jgi:hypothetical protein
LEYWSIEIPECRFPLEENTEVKKIKKVPEAKRKRSMSSQK